VAILYSDPIFQGQFLGASRGLFYYIHVIDAICLAKGVGQYCVRQIMPDLTAGLYNNILPIPGHACYDSLVAQGNTCPACGDEIKNLTTSHGCCAIALYRLAGLAKAINDAGTSDRDNRDDATFPANRMIKGFNDKCPAQATQIVRYCTAVAINFRITLRNIAVAVYLAAPLVFHALVIADIAEFLGMVANDINIDSGMAVQGSSPWYSDYVPASFVSQDASQGVTLSINVMPDNTAAGSDIDSFVSSSLASGDIPFPNAASDIKYIVDPTVEVTASESAASTVAVSCMLLVVLALLQL